MDTPAGMLTMRVFPVRDVGSRISVKQTRIALFASVLEESTQV